MPNKRVLNRFQQSLFFSVHSRPIIQQNAAGIARIRVERPECPTQPFLLDIGQKLLQPLLVALIHVARAKFTNQQGGYVLVINVAPVMVPHRRQIVRVVGVREPLLWEHRGGVFVWRIDQTVGHIQAHRILAHAQQIATPPGAISVFPGVVLTTRPIAFHAFNDNQQIGVDRQNGVSSTLRRQPPITRWVATAPTSIVVRLVAQVNRNHGIVSGIAAHQHFPVGDPATLRVIGGVPKPTFLRTRPRIGAVVIQNHLQAPLSGAFDNLVHNFQRGQSHQIGVFGVINPRRHGARIQHLIGKRQANTVVAQRFDLIEHLFPIARPQAMHHVVARLKAKPVDPAKRHHIAIGVANLVAACMQITAGCRFGRRQRCRSRPAQKPGAPYHCHHDHTGVAP
ncbi:hypothetical protein ARMA_2433 [Ardenticatena maritima]|uniref:Uncharacterized protein n=1 Tax=Ardenticatena maritima TaxID=872965 RepID=A0A0M9UDH5_9CHLR|nr:hypothetical protein ARMA_2433 [Ardenticatena maritima]